MPFGMKLAIRALTVLLILCGAALLVLSLRPARIERMPQAPAASTAGQNLGQFTALAAPLPAPALAFTTRDGVPKQLADYKGQLVLVNLWATWCVPCVEEMPALERLQAQLGDKLAILAISQDRQGETVVATFLEQHAIKHLAIFLDPKSAATSEFGAQGLPSSYLIARNGTIVGKEEGAAKWDSPEMIGKLQPYLDAK